MEERSNSAMKRGTNVMRLTQRSWTGISASGMPRRTVRKILREIMDQLA
jgi:hypothetical protein